ncbi:MAG: hypothetical protein HKP55_15395, partial [Gammaproteobacteria bacterium]|nr:hypothetical protein [Gammaproteobacteria bacterium]
MKMKKIAVACSAAMMGLSTLGMSSVASADSHGNMGLSFSANVAMVTDYVFRGISFSNNEAAVQGGFDAEHTSGVYAGIWGSSINGYGGTEIDYYIGWAGDVGPVGLDLGVTEYTAPGNSSFDGTEFFIGASKDLGPVSVALYYYDADDYDGQQTWELSGEVPVGMFTLSAAWGTQDYDETPVTGLTDYDYWGVGASTELGGFGFALNY